MATANNLTTYEPLIKENYTSKVRTATFRRKYPLLSRLTFSPREGSPMVVPMVTSHGGGIASTLSAAQASAKGLKGDQWLVTHGQMVGIVPLSTLVRKVAGKAGPGAQIDYVKNEIDAKLSGMGSLVNMQAYGAGGGSIGRRGSVAGNVITLTERLDALNFWIDMQIVASSANGEGGADALRGGTPATVTAVDRDAGTVTVDAVANITSFADNDYIFVRGMFAGAVSQTEIAKGVGAYFPLTAPTTALFGLARTGRSELAGFRLGTGTVTGGVTERIIKLAEHGNSLYGATPGHAFLHTKQWGAAAREQQAQGFRSIAVGATTSQAGYSKLMMSSVAGEIELVNDPQCPPDRVHLLDLDTVKLVHAPGIGTAGVDESAADAAEAVIDFEQDDKGAIWIPSTTELGHEIRMTAFFNLTTEAPWNSGVALLPALVA